MTERELNNLRFAILKYKQETECTYCKYCVRPYVMRWAYTCRLNNRPNSTAYNDSRGMYCEANPLLCGGGTKRYSY